MSVRVDFDLEMTTRDGVTLRADVYRRETDEPLPAIVLRTPYNKAMRHVRLGGFNPIMAAQNGYAFVIQDVRGRWASEGEYSPISPVEGPDGYDCIEWVASEPWCDGNVGTIGQSYEALVQLLAAAEQPPSLKAIVPEYGGDDAAHGAMLLDSIVIGWVAYQAIDHLQKKVAAGEGGLEDFGVVMNALSDPQSAASHLPLDQMPLMKLQGLPSYGEFIESLRNVTRLRLENIQVPALILGAWYDVDAPGTARLYRRLRSVAATEAARDGTSVVWGPWEHAAADLGLGEQFYGVLATAEGRNLAGLYLSFFDRHLKAQTGVPVPTASYFVTGTNAWEEAGDWPPPAAHKLALYLSSAGHANAASGDGTLQRSVPQADAYDCFKYDPHEPVPSFGGRYLKMGGSRPGPFDQRRIEVRPDVLVYTAAPLEEPLKAVGQARLRLFAASSAVDTDFVAKLCDVDLDGVSNNICDAILRLRYRDGYEEPAFIEPHEVYELEIDLGPIGHVFKAGHRVRLQLTSSAFPAYDRNMNTGNPEGSDDQGIIAEQRVCHGGTHPSCLELDVVTS